MSAAMVQRRGFLLKYAISEHDYSSFEMAHSLNVAQEDAHTVMIFDGRWKYVHCEGFAPILLDLDTDPQELLDIGRSSLHEHQEVRCSMKAAFLSWATQHHSRITTTNQVLTRQRGTTDTGVLIGFWDEAEYESDTGKRFSDLRPMGRPE